MTPWLKLASARVADGTEISLWQRGDELVIRAGTADLMSNRLHASEELLAEHGCAGLGGGARVLVGGLGMGFTLRSALALLAADARVVVSEFCPAVVEWVRGPIGAGDLLDDPRVSVDLRPVGDLMRASPASFDAILLDVDNGPRAVIDAANRWLYEREGVATMARALRPGGRLAVWSAGDDHAFEGLLRSVGLDASTVRARARRDGEDRGRGARHVVFLGVKPEAGRDRGSQVAPAPRRRDPRSRRSPPR